MATGVGVGLPDNTDRRRLIKIHFQNLLIVEKTTVILKIHKYNNVVRYVKLHCIHEPVGCMGERSFIRSIDLMDLLAGIESRINNINVLPYSALTVLILSAHSGCHCTNLFRVRWVKICLRSLINSG